MTLEWQWPWAAGVAALLAGAIVLATLALASRRAAKGRQARVFSLDDDLNTELASSLFRQWRWLSRLAMAALVVALALALTLAARPSTVDRGEERAARRDIVLCLDVSGSTLPYDREVIDTYLELVKHFQGERIGMSIFNSTSRTVFPLTDDYELVTRQLTEASRVLRGVETQDDIDAMSDKDYQAISDWLDGTQNRRDATSLIGDGVVSCAAMIPGFAYGSSDENGDDSGRRRAASIVLATDNVVSGEPTYALDAALDLTSRADITVDGLFSGAQTTEGNATTTEMRTLIESHDGVFMTRAGGESVGELVRDIDSRRLADSQANSQAAVVDTPGWWTLALALVVILWLATVWRLRR